MKIVDKVKFILGIINLLGGIALIILCVYKHRMDRVVYCLFPILCGIASLMDGIETKKQRLRRIAELKEKAKLYGWDREQTRNLTDEETEICNSWIDSGAEDTGENILDGEQNEDN